MSDHTTYECKEVIFYDDKQFLTAHLLYLTGETTIKSKGNMSVFADFMVSNLIPVLQPTEKELMASQNFGDKDNFWLFKKLKTENVSYFDATPDTITVNGKEFTSAKLACRKNVKTIESNPAVESSTTKAPYKELQLAADEKFTVMKAGESFQNSIHKFLFLQGGNTVNRISITLHGKDDKNGKPRDVHFNCYVAPVSMKNDPTLRDHLKACKAQLLSKN